MNWPLLALLAAVAVIYGPTFVRVPEDHECARGVEVGVPAVEVVDMAGAGAKEYTTLARRRRPVILRNSIALTWPAYATWDMEYLSARIPDVPVHFQTGNPSFITYHDGRPLEPLLREKWTQFNIMKTARTASLYDKVRVIQPRWIC